MCVCVQLLTLRSASICCMVVRARPLFKNAFMRASSAFLMDELYIVACRQLAQYSRKCYPRDSARAEATTVRVSLALVSHGWGVCSSTVSAELPRWCDATNKTLLHFWFVILFRNAIRHALLPYEQSASA